MRTNRTAGANVFTSFRRDARMRRDFDVCQRLDFEDFCSHQVASRDLNVPRERLGLHDFESHRDARTRTDLDARRCLDFHDQEFELRQYHRTRRGFDAPHHLNLQDFGARQGADRDLNVRERLGLRDFESHQDARTRRDFDVCQCLDFQDFESRQDARREFDVRQRLSLQDFESCGTLVRVQRLRLSLMSQLP